jgi:hypothetical protein
MTNRARLIKHTDLYDLLTRIQKFQTNDRSGCIIEQIIGSKQPCIASHKLGTHLIRCRKYLDISDANKDNSDNNDNQFYILPNCEQCIADWLNEEEV